MPAPPGTARPPQDAGSDSALRNELEVMRRTDRFRRQGALQRGSFEASRSGTGPINSGAETPIDLDLGITPEDLALIEQSIGATSDIARRELETTVGRLQQQSRSGIAARGLSGSSIQAAENALISTGAQNQFADILSQQQALASNALLELPLQRAGLELGANRLAVERMLGLAGLDIDRQRIAEQRRQFDLNQETARKNRRSGALGGIFKGAAKLGLGFAIGGPAGAAAALGLDIPGRRSKDNGVAFDDRNERA